jgi:hypothetical protein
MSSLDSHIFESEKWERLSRIETIGEMLVRFHAIKLSQLIKLVQEWKDNPDIPLGQLAVEKGLISKESLFTYLEMQSKAGQVIDQTLNELGHMTNEEKWERLLLNSQTLGDILINKKILKLSQLTEAMEEKRLNPEKSLENILLEKALVSKEEIKEALDYFMSQEEVTFQAAKEIVNYSK